MKERSILFSAPMVRALLDGTKSQTRRVCKPMNQWVEQECREVRMVDGVPHHFLKGATAPIEKLRSPYGQPGDRLWVRETWRGVVEISPPSAPVEHGVARYVPDQQHCRRVEYAATQERDSEPWRPSIHMPRWASRILLEITSVRVERLWEITEPDARAEGIALHETGLFQADGAGRHLHNLATGAYRELWESINGAGSWSTNPWVWVVEFKRVMP